MALKKNKYRPETDFEQEGSLSGLIEKLRSVPREEVSEDFDERFEESLRNVKPLIPLKKRIKDFLILPEFRPYLSASLATAALALILLFMFTGKENPPQNNLANPDKDTLIRKTNIQETKPAVPSVTQSAKEKKMADSVINNSRPDDRAQRALGEKLVSPEKIDDIIKQSKNRRDSLKKLRSQNPLQELNK